MAGLFVCLTIPVLIVILGYSYYRNSQSMIVTLDSDVAKTRQASMENVEDMIRGVSGTLRILSEISQAEPEFLRTEGGREVLYQALISREEIDAAFVSYEDGYHRAVTRIDANRRRAEPRILPTANWHMNYIDPFSAGENRRRHRQFYDTWDHQIDEYSMPTNIDYRKSSGYPEVQASLAFAVTEPGVNPDTGFPVVFVRYPIMHGGVFVGATGATITTNVLSKFLADHRASPNSTTVVANPLTLAIVATSRQDTGVKMEGGKLEVARLDSVEDADVREAYRRQRQEGRNQFVFRSSRNGEEMSASFAEFSQGSGLPWEVIVVTPVDDFIGQLKKTNREVAVIIVVLSLLDLIAIYFLARRLARPIETISEQLRSVESWSFEPRLEHGVAPPSGVREIAHLQSAASLLRNSLLSFSYFAPVDVVRNLIKSRIPLALGVERRPLTVFFCDLENFSSHAERLSADALLKQMSVYFDCVTSAISGEEGTVDKFIGDGVMAFWGAPQDQPDQALRACRGALEAVRRLELANEVWRAEGSPTFRLRIGLHCGEALVGNVGSAERFSYTAMGDVVNVAARLEGLNKEYGTSICISDSLYESVKSDVRVRPLGSVRVKGREQEFPVYELLGIVGAELTVSPGSA